MRVRIPNIYNILSKLWSSVSQKIKNTLMYICILYVKYIVSISTLILINRLLKNHGCFPDHTSSDFITSHRVCKY